VVFIPEVGLLMVGRHIQFGKKGEAIAARHLKRCGYKIVARNYRNKVGEIDIVARDGETLCFVEVKTRRGDQFGNPKLAVTFQKQKKISMVALSYLKEFRLDGQKARFDVVAVMDNGKKPVVEIIKNAFELAYK
jgi:putative endonuclease